MKVQMGIATRSRHEKYQNWLIIQQKLKNACNKLPIYFPYKSAIYVSVSLLFCHLSLCQKTILILSQFNNSLVIVMQNQRF